MLTNDYIEVLMEMCCKSESFAYEGLIWLNIVCSFYAFISFFIFFFDYDESLLEIWIGAPAFFKLFICWKYLYFLPLTPGCTIYFWFWNFFYSFSFLSLSLSGTGEFDFFIFTSLIICLIKNIGICSDCFSFISKVSKLLSFIEIYWFFLKPVLFN